MATTALSRDFLPRRGKARLRLGIPAYVFTMHGRRRVTLLDLSESGARVRYDGEGFSNGVLEWLGYEAFGSVVRRGRQEIGLQFDHPIEPAWVLGTRDRLPEIARAEDQASRFAREWAKGRDSRPDPTGRGTGALPGRRGGGHPGARKQASVIGTWLGIARPFLLGGVAIGLIAGFASTFL